MSYFIASHVTISKDFKTYKVKGGDNNVIPRSSYWSRDIPIEHLYGEVHGGMTKIRAKDERALCINDTIFTTHYGGSWDSEDDYYHTKSMFYVGKKEIANRIVEYEKKELNDWSKARLTLMKKFYENWDEHRKKYDDFNEMFLKKLKENLKTKPKGLYNVKTKSGAYVDKVLKDKYYIAHYKSDAKKFGYYMAKLIAERYEGEIEKV